MPSDRTVDVVVRLRPDVAQAARGGAAAPAAAAAARSIGEAVGRAGGEMRPQHPGSPDPALGGYFLVGAPSADAAGELASGLLGMDGVEAAYVKPQPAMP